jgi:hypothetical protein
MVQVCEGTVTKHDMLHQGLNQYKEMFVIVRREFQRVTSVRLPYAQLMLRGKLMSMLECDTVSRRRRKCAK